MPVCPTGSERLEMIRTRNMTHLPWNLTEGLSVRASYSQRLLSCPPVMVRPSPFVAALCTPQ